MFLKGCKCLVTGASSGIGRAACKVLTDNGAMVVGSGRDLDALQSLQNDDKSIVGYIQIDLAAEVGGCQRLVADAVQMLGGTLTTVVNAAGALRGGAVGSPETNLQNYEFNMKINAQVPFEMITAAVPFLKQAAAAAAESSSSSSSSSSTICCSPSIVTVSSVNGLQSFPGCATYCMSKAAVDQLTRCASVDLAPYGIRVNSVNPGVVKTNLHRVS
jgi:NAD(P)-dependent dehydrogenase (short-subunit alcohol dehydrogenase family)